MGCWISLSWSIIRGLCDFRLMRDRLRDCLRRKPLKDRFERHRQAWTTEEVQKLHMMAGKGMSLKAIAKGLTRSEESTKKRAKQDKLKIQKLR